MSFGHFQQKIQEKPAHDLQGVPKIPKLDFYNKKNIALFARKNDENVKISILSWFDFSDTLNFKNHVGNVN